MASVASEGRTRASEEAGTSGAPDRELAAAVASVHAALRTAPLPLDLPGAAPLRDERARVLAQLDDYVVPRLAALDAPALVVVAGPTGVGKSTLVNSLVGRKVTTPGLLRPTTRSPVLVHHPADRSWFGPDRVLPTLDRVDRPTTDPQAIQLVPSESVPQGVAILDAPDFDSIDDRNRELATKLLAAADLLLFVTSAARYSDQVPWLQLSMAIERETAVAVVMNRIPAEDRATVTPHLTRMLRTTGVPTDPLFFVEHGPVTDDALLPPAYVAELRQWVDALAADTARRSGAVRQTVRGAVRRAGDLATRLADAARRQVEALCELLALVDRVYTESAERLGAALGDATLLRGDLLVQWQDLAVRRDLASAPEAEVHRMGVTLDLALETLVVDHAARAAEQAGRELRAARHGEALVAWSREDLTGPGRGLASRAHQAIRAWRQDLAVRSGGDAPAIDLVVRALSGQAATDPVAEARTSLGRTLTGLLTDERDRYLGPVQDSNLAPDAPARLLAAADHLDRALARHPGMSAGPTDGPGTGPGTGQGGRS